MIGRNPNQVDYVIDSSNFIQSSYISRNHARVVRQPGNIHRLYDDSLNGVFVNNQKISDSVKLNEGDLVIFGHPGGVRLPPGNRTRQPDSEYQFIFEECNCPDEDLPSSDINRLPCEETSVVECSSTTTTTTLQRDIFDEESSSIHNQNSTISDTTTLDTCHTENLVCHPTDIDSGLNRKSPPLRNMRYDSSEKLSSRITFEKSPESMYPSYKDRMSVKNSGTEPESGLAALDRIEA
ncbi:hypothetical protein Ahia01_000608000, partial [Argonauta hians]